MTNLEINKGEIRKIREAIEKLGGNLKEADKRVLTGSVNRGLNYAKMNTPVITGHLKRSWAKTPTMEKDGVVETSLINTAEYALAWNNGHRIVRNGVTIGFCTGSHLLEKVEDVIVNEAEKLFAEELRKL